MTARIHGMTTVRELVGHDRRTQQVFEKFGIDYCCGGGQSLAAAAEAHGLQLPVLVAALEKALETPPSVTDQAETDRSVQSLASLVDHIVQTHHAYLNQALPRLRGLTATVLKAHRANHGVVLQEVWRLFSSLADELESHLRKEELVLFPYVAALDEAIRKGTTPPPSPCGSVTHPIHQMENEHAGAGGVLEELRRVTDNYTLPPDACPTFTALYEELQRLEADLHQHIHLENNTLFPRAVEMERHLNRNPEEVCVVPLTTIAR